MLVSEAITHLRNTELKQLSAVANDDAAMIGFLNEAVLELHKRFNLWQDEAIITIAAGTASYKLDGIDPNVTIDLSDKQLTVITALYDPEGIPLRLNDEDDPNCAVTPKYNVVEFPVDEIDALDQYSVLFRAAPLDMTAVGDPIDLPPTLFEPMYFYVGFRAHVGQRGAKENENDTHFKRFLNSCDRVDALGQVVPDSVQTHKLGFNHYPWP